MFATLYSETTWAGLYLEFHFEFGPNFFQCTEDINYCALGYYFIPIHMVGDSQQARPVKNFNPNLTLTPIFGLF